MARTRGAAAIAGNVMHEDEGVLLGKDGEPINPIAHSSTWTGVSGQAAFIQTEPVATPVLEPEVPQVPIRYRCDAGTIGRDIDGWTAFRLLELCLGGGLSVELTESQYRALSADLKINIRSAK